MKIYIARHATATDRLGGSVTCDEERHLIHEGKVEAEAMAIALSKLGVKPHHFLCSPLVRARQTAEIFAEVLADRHKVHITERLAPGGEFDDLFAEIADLKHSGEVFLFGHMPDIQMLAGRLLGAPDIEIPFKKAAVCRIDVFSMPPAEPGVLKWFLTPRMVQSIK